VPFEEALKKGWICVLCHVTKTRVAVCNACTTRCGYKKPPSEEKLSRALLAEMLGHHFQYGTHLGGEACAKDVPVGNNGKAKYAYCDATLFDGKKVAFIEFDERAHPDYPVECELSRLHTLHHGCETERVSTRCFRLNTSFSVEDPTPIEVRVRVLAENIRQFFDERDTGKMDTEQFGALGVTYLHYPANSVHMAAAIRATGSLVVVDPYVTSIDKVRDEFKDIGLEDIAPETLEAVCMEDINRYREEFGKVYSRCTAARKSPAGVLNAVRCTGYCRKDFPYCWRHSLQDEAYKHGSSNAKQVVEFEKASTSETLSSSACINLDGVTPPWSPNEEKLEYFSRALLLY